MSKDLGRSADESADGDSSNGDGSFFAWEFVNDQPQGQAPHETADPGASNTRSVRSQKEPRPEIVASSLAPPTLESGGTAKSHPASNNRSAKAPAAKSRDFGTARANFIRDQLDKALDLWWAMGELPPLLLLRDALLMLEAGGSATESQRTLLLRAAMAYNRGIQTALRYQVDGERVAFVVAEALVEWEPPLETERLTELLKDDGQLRLLLKTELERSRILLTGEPQRRAESALGVLTQSAVPIHVAITPNQPQIDVTTKRTRRLREILFLLLVMATIGFVLWNRSEVTPSGMIAMPGAEYALINQNGMGSARLDAFFIDRFEVTNGSYRSCIDAGKCSWPLSTSSSTRNDYFTNPAFDEYPVIEVTQAMAEGYCMWKDKRLPTVAEWQVAASVSPTTGQAFAFPWGESFDRQRANSAESGYGDTVMIGLFRPGGDSASGAVDMAGNVAEWTALSASVPTSTTTGMKMVAVKGGSFMSEPDNLNVGAQVTVDSNRAWPDVGFRCAKAQLLTQS